jgi:D-glycero-D-manno-heptose 1,7-bisphosphate phosphatase
LYPLKRMKITIFLDRDGVINEKASEGDYIKSPEELKLIDGAAEAIKYFNERGFLVIIITNQRGIGRGIMSKEAFESVMGKLKEELKKKGAYIDAYYYCPDVDDNSPDRKPNIGMFFRAKKDFPDIDFEKSFVIGDSWRDIEAGRRIGAKTILIGPPLCKVKSDYISNSLWNALLIIKEYLLNSNLLNSKYIKGGK